MGPIGGIESEGEEVVTLTGDQLVRIELDKLRNEIRNYLGTLNEILMGLKPDTVVEKPEALALYDKCKMVGLPLVAGGLMDQPHIWLKEFEVCEQEVARFQTAERKQPNRSVDDNAILARKETKQQVPG